MWCTSACKWCTTLPGSPTYSKKKQKNNNCRNAFHTANHHTNCPQERGSKHPVGEYMIAIWSCKIRKPKSWLACLLILESFYFAFRLKTKASKVKLSAFPVKWPCLSLATFPSIPSLPPKGLGQEATPAHPLNPFWNQEVGLVWCLRVCACVFVFANWGHENGEQTVATHSLWGRLVFSSFPPILSSSGQGKYSHLP